MSSLCVADLGVAAIALFEKPTSASAFKSAPMNQNQAQMVACLGDTRYLSAKISVYKQTHLSTAARVRPATIAVSSLSFVRALQLVQRRDQEEIEECKEVQITTGGDAQLLGVAGAAAKRHESRDAPALLVDFHKEFVLILLPQVLTDRRKRRPEFFIVHLSRAVVINAIEGSREPFLVPFLRLACTRVKGPSHTHSTAQRAASQVKACLEAFLQHERLQLHSRDQQRLLPENRTLSGM